jgi:hypothetical protein
MEKKACMRVKFRKGWLYNFDTKIIQFYHLLKYLVKYFTK